MARRKSKGILRGSLEAYLQDQAKDYAWEKIKEAREKKKKKKNGQT